MSDPQQFLPAAGAMAAANDDETVEGAEQGSSGPTVGASDAAADAARSGADVDVDTTGANRDTDGVPVGEADLEADKRA